MDRGELNPYFDGMANSSKLAIQAVKKLMAKLDGLPPEMIRDAMLDAVPTLVASFGQLAASAALQWYAAQREDATTEKDWRPDQLAGPLDPDEIRKAVRAAAGQLWVPEEGSTEKFVAELSGRIDRWVKGQARETILRNIERDPDHPKFARVPRGPKTCAFCEMVASNGFVYRSEDSAMGRLHDKFHTDCDCQIVSSWGIKDLRIAGYHPEQMYARYAAARNAVEEVGLDVNDHELVAQTMRRMFPDQYKDGTRIALGEVREEGATKDGTVPYRKWDRHRNSVIERYNADVRIWLRGGKVPPRNPEEVPKDWPDDIPSLSAKKWNHILYSEFDDKIIKGGHLNGYGWISKINPDGKSKTEFPADWTKEDIFEAIQHVLRNDWDGTVNAPVLGSYNGIQVEFFVAGKKSGYRQLITAYPKEEGY